VLETSFGPYDQDAVKTSLAFRKKAGSGAISGEAANAHFVMAITAQKLTQGDKSSEREGRPP
jgi:hypothetical protein